MKAQDVGSGVAAAAIRACLAALLDGLLGKVTEQGLRELEAELAAGLTKLGGQALALLIGAKCKAEMEADIAERGLEAHQWRLRTDDTGYALINTTFGPIVPPTFAILDLSGPSSVTRLAGIQRVLPYRGSCRSTPLCLEWEATFGTHLVFRQAEELMRFATRGASTVEDTTIERHMVKMNAVLDSTWLYQTPEAVRHLVETRASRDRSTGRPLIYASTDAHALRRYVGGTWKTEWKMANGVRLWLEDAVTGEIIHLGGEFLWGDCQAIAARFQALVATGVLPNADKAWQALNPQVVLLSDGAEWILDWVVPVLPPDAIVTLDAYHLLEWVAVFARSVFCKGTAEGAAFMDEARSLIFGKTLRRRRREKLRRGHRRPRARPRRRRRTHQAPSARRGRPRTKISEATADALVALVKRQPVETEEQRQAQEILVAQLNYNFFRIDYQAYLARGLQVGSGAMESMHRTGSQLRLKRPGSKWLQETSQAVLNFRMLALSGRWNEFWRRANLTEQLALAFRRENPTGAAA